MKKTTKQEPRVKRTKNAPITKPDGMSKAEEKAYEEALRKAQGDSWQPTEPGEKRSGKVTAMEGIKTKFGSATVMHLRQDDGSNSSMILGTVLQGLVKKEKVKVGDRVMVVFRGYGGGQKGRPARLFGLTKF